MLLKQYKVLGCVMAFYPGEGFKEACERIARFVDFLLIVDNSPDSTLELFYINLPTNSEIIYNKNEGAVSGALNIALRRARESGFDYLQVFDQDTALTQEITDALIAGLQRNPTVALLSPRFVNLNTGFPGRVMLNLGKWRVKNIWPRTDIGLVNALFAITSATVIDVKKLPAELYYDERLIIDGVDVDFCLALRTAGLEIRVDTAQCIVHGIGNRRDGGGRWSPTNYSAHRKFLGAKNRVMVWRRYFRLFPGFVLNDIYVFILDSARTVLLENQRLKKSWAILEGLISGFSEKSIKTRKHKRASSINSGTPFDVTALL